MPSLKMKSYSLALLLALAADFSACQSPPLANGCYRFHRGQFTYHLQGPGNRVDILVTRNDSIQTEYYQQTGDMSRLAIDWVDSCSYELRLISSTLKFSAAVTESRKRNVLRTDIISSTADYYVFRSKRDNVDFVMTDTLWVKK